MALDIGLYLMTMLIWGSTWFAIKCQLGVVAPGVSVGYRFTIAALILFAWCACKRVSFKRLRPIDHLFMILQGFFSFGINYQMAYLAAQWLNSGVNAVVFSTVLIFNLINSVIFLRSPLRGSMFLGAGLAIAGIATVFWPQLQAQDFDHAALRGLGISAAGALSASLGNLISARHQRQGLHIPTTNAFGMAYGAIFSMTFVLVCGEALNFDLRPSYIASLFYLSIVGSVVAFGCYFKLLGRIGPERAVFALALTPVVALAISTVWEGFAWDRYALVGIGLVVTGNMIALRKSKRPAASTVSPQGEWATKS